MKKILIAAIALLVLQTARAQTPEDALRYSWLTPSGTARVTGLAGASGAIGGEISTLFSNPGNLGFYKTGDIVISGGFTGNSNKATYFGETNADNKNAAFFGTSGVVLGNPSYRNGALKSSAFGIAVTRVADFNNAITFSGVNTKSSMADMFIEDVNAHDGELYDYGSDLAYRSHWINDDANNVLFSPATNIAKTTGVIQQGTLRTNGGITEIAIGGGANFNDKVYFGGSVGLPILRYGATRTFDEVDPEDNQANGFNGAYFDDDLVTKGMGINVKLGAVFTPTQNFRIGIAAHSPTWYSLTDNYDAAAGADTENLPQNGGTSNTDVIPNQPLQFDYSIQTPYKLIGSLAYMFGNVKDVASQKGFITADVEYVNYMASTFKAYDNDGMSDRNYYRGLNDAIDNAYKGTVNARLGAELKFNTIMARIGGAYYGNPYRDLAGESGNIYQGSAGIGYRNRGFFVDLGYIHTFKDDVYFPYRLENPNNFEPATIKNNGPRVVLTFGFKI